MITFKNKVHIVESISELPNLPGDVMFLDLETTSFDDKTEAFFPYLGHRACGIAVTTNEMEDAFYVPIRHRHGKNLPVDQVIAWLQAQSEKMTKWVNHNVKFDAHFLVQDGYNIPCRMIDTVVLAKLIDSDRMEHKLKSLCREWCGMLMEEEHELGAFLKGIKSKDYGATPIDMCGRYACMDVIGNKTLYYECLKRLDSSLIDVAKVEIEFTALLFKIEQRGMRVDLTQTKVDKARALRKMVAAADIIKQDTGVEYVSSPECNYEILVNQLGLPVLAVTENGNPSFDKDAMLLYVNHVDVLLDERKQRVINAISEFSTEQTYVGLFLDSFLTKADSDGIIHPSYNQLVRTGRMSCSDPNSQQFNPRAKRLMIPRPGYGFVCSDASQIEFRVITHYGKIQAAIESYNSDANTDYHRWAADLCRVERDAAKTLNFAMAYGAGKRRMIQQLSHNKSVIAECIAKINPQPGQDVSALVKKMVTERAEEIYQIYHEKLPEIRAIARRASDTAKVRGYIRTAYGRRRHLPPNMCHKAFNSLSQGCAMDIIKRRMIALDKQYDGTDCHIIANVHDELLNEVPLDKMNDKDFRDKTTSILEDVEPGMFSVPFKWKTGFSDKNWKEAKP